MDDEARRNEARKRARELIAKLPPADDEAFRRIEAHTANWYGPLSPETLERIKQHVAERSTQRHE